MATPAINFGTAACRAKCYSLSGAPLGIDRSLQSLQAGNLKANCAVACDADTGESSGGADGNDAAFVGQSVFVDATTGSDATGAPYRFDLMYATVRAAFAAASAGDTVYIYPGQYDESLLGDLILPPDVNVYGMRAAPTTLTAVDLLIASSTVNVIATLVPDVQLTTTPVSTITNIRLSPPVGAQAFRSEDAPNQFRRGEVFWVSCVISENAGGGAGADGTIQISNTLTPFRARDCRIVSALTGGIEPTTPILVLEDGCAAILQAGSVSGVVQDTTAATVTAEETRFDGFSSMLLLGSWTLRDCQFVPFSGGFGPPSLGFRGPAVTLDNVIVSLAGVTFSPIGIAPTYVLKNSEFRNGLVFSGDDTMVVSVSQCVVSAEFICTGVSGTLKFENSVFRDIFSFIINHATAGGGMYEFYNNVIECDSSLAFSQTVVSVVGVQSMTFSGNVVEIANISDTASIRYNNGSNDSVADSYLLHIFTRNTFNNQVAPPVYSIESVAPFQLFITSGGNTSNQGAGANVTIATPMTVD